VGETRLDREIRLRQGDLRRAIGRQIRDLREDEALTRSAVADAAHIDRSFEGRIETGAREPSLSTLVAIATVLGADLSVRLYPTTGPRIRDRIQAPIVEALLHALHPRWRAMPEVPVHRPARGVVDAVLANETDIVATEVHSEVRRLEQQIRWHREKEESLPSADVWRFLAAERAPTTSRLLVLRSTRATRELARAYTETLRAAYPAATRDAVAALTGKEPWPGSAIVWASVESSRAEILDGPPRGIGVGR